jgi:hypothetical protein
MLEQAKKYYEHGISVIPVGANKLPIGAWTQNMKELIEPKWENLSYEGIGVVCGAVSGNIEVIDIDEKYSLDGKLFDNYKKSIASVDKNLLAKLVVETTPTGGKHFIYRCKTIGRNQKLAKRPTTEAERVDNPKEKVKVLIETRGNGGYIKAYPSPNYTMLHGDFTKINEITEEERAVLFSCALEFNEVFDDVIKPNYTNRPKLDGLSPFDDYNQRGDILSVLLSEGWTLVKENSKNYFLKRSGNTTSPHSATLHKQTNVLYVFSTSTEFEAEKGYAPATVYGILKHNRDFSACAKDLLDLGYGERITSQKPPQNAKKEASKIKVDDADFSFLADKAKIHQYIQMVVDGTLPVGLETGLHCLDNNFRFKRANFNVIGGHDNVGKTFVIMFLLMQSAKLHGWKWFVVSVENSAGSLTRMLVEFYHKKAIKHLNQSQIMDAMIFIEKHFDIVDNQNSYNYLDVLAMGEKLWNAKKIDGIFIDPYNALELDEGLLKTYGDHNYHYRVTSAFRNFTKKHDCCIYLNCHAVTEALRRTWGKDNAPDSEVIGHPMPPKKSDIEGGGKFANRADDFLIIHRYTQHKSLYRVTEIHVVKTKETETGGKNTPLSEPIKLTLADGNCNFLPYGFHEIYEDEPSATFIEKPPF